MSKNKLGEQCKAQYKLRIKLLDRNFLQLRLSSICAVLHWAFFHWSHLLLRASSTKVFFHWDYLQLRSTFIEVDFHWSHLLLRSSSFEIVFQWGSLPLRLSSIEVNFHWGRLFTGNGNKICLIVFWTQINIYIIYLFFLGGGWINRTFFKGREEGRYWYFEFFPLSPGILLICLELPCSARPSLMW